LFFNYFCHGFAVTINESRYGGCGAWLGRRRWGPSARRGRCRL